MARFILAADPPLAHTLLVSRFVSTSPAGYSDSAVLLNGSVSGQPATIEVTGSGFGANGSGPRAGTATVTGIRMSLSGSPVVEFADIVLTGGALTSWLLGFGSTFETTIFTGADFMRLSNLSEFQSGYGGNDTIFALGGADTIYGGAGNDLLFGGSGIDSLWGDDGQDALFGEDGADNLYGGGGDDSLTGGAGNDYLSGTAGYDAALTGALRRQCTVTNPTLFGTLSGPEGTDTLAGIDVVRFADGAMHFNASGPAGQVHRLYLAALSRTADPVGLGTWTQALESGALTARGVAEAFVGCPEFGARFGSPGDAGYVTLLYQNVLGRVPDALGLAAWTGALQGGMARAETLLRFADSAEFTAQVSGRFGAGVWAPGPEAVDVLRLYMAVLDRLPDAAGLHAWAAARDGGHGLADMAGQFAASFEFQSRTGGLSNRGFVEELYMTALDRAGDAGGVGAWAAALDAGALTRGDVVLGFAFSQEMTAKLSPLVADGVVFV